MKRTDSEYTKEAISILRGQYLRPEKILVLARQLKLENSFDLARKILHRALQDREMEKDEKLKLRIAQQQALVTYKDSGLPLSDRLNRALEILEIECNLRESTNAETLGLAGAIYKRKWEAEARKTDLEKSLYYYLRGYKNNVAEDFGYCGINAAYVLDLLASIEEMHADELKH